MKKILNLPGCLFMNIVITGDLKSSKKMEDRSTGQENLKNALETINNTYSTDILAKFRIIGGDGFQGMISRPHILIDIYYILFEKINHPFYLGVGIGSISTDLSPNIQEIDGPAFHYSSQSLEIAKKKKRWVVVQGDFENYHLMECILNFMFESMWNWTPRRKEIILYYRKEKEGPLSIEKASLKFETGRRNIYKILEVGQYPLIRYGEETLKEEFEKYEIH